MTNNLKESGNMKIKSIFISRLIYSLFVTMLLIYLFIKTSDGKVIIFPFLICSFSLLGKNIFLVLGKKNIVKLFNKIFIYSFLLFCFGFLLFWSYINFVNKEYISLLFSLLFLVVGIGLGKKYLFKTNKKQLNSKINFNFKIIISIFLVAICLFSGILMLFFGIKDTYYLNKKTKNYITINAYFNSYDIYDIDDDGTTYTLTYIYTIDDKEYSISTDYGTNYIPDENSTKKIKYNPNNPGEAIITGTNGKNSLIFIGAFFTFGTLTFILAVLSMLGYFDKFKIDILGTYIGLLFLMIGIGIILWQNGTTMSLIETIKSFRLWVFIPLMFIFVGVFQLIRCLILKQNIKK